MKDNELTYQVYSEFKTSDWYVYWDKEYSRAKMYQLLVVWHVKGDGYTNFDYTTLKKLLASNTAQNGLPYHSTLNKEAIKEFLAICNEFIADIDVEFGKED